MDRRKKIGLAGFVLAVGIGVALQFRKPDSAPGPRRWPEDRPESTAAQAEIDSLPVGAAANAATSFAGRIDMTPGPKPATAAPATAAAAPPPPGLLDSAAPAVAGRSQDRSPSFPARVATAQPASDLLDLHGSERMHKIVDGDTLTELARRYLGDPNRYLELYESNRDVLRGPDVLPIGAELRVSQRIPLHQQPAANPLRPNQPPADALVAVPSTSAKPAAAAKPAPRTYTVQAGDNLVDIARKLYGDGRRHEQLFEANRRTLRHPGDLKPGTVLTVP